MSDPIPFPGVPAAPAPSRKAFASIVYNDTLGQTVTIHAQHEDGTNTLAINFAPPLPKGKGVKDPCGLIEGLFHMIDFLKSGGEG